MRLSAGCGGCEAGSWRCFPAKRRRIASYARFAVWFVRRIACFVPNWPKRAILRTNQPAARSSHRQSCCPLSVRTQGAGPRSAVRRGPRLGASASRRVARAGGPRNAFERQPKASGPSAKPNSHPRSRKCQDSVTMGRVWVDVCWRSANIGPSNATGVRASAHASRKPCRFGALNRVLRFCRGPQTLGNMMTCTNLDIRIFSSII